MNSTVLRLSQSLLAIVLLSLSWVQAHADTLPPVENANITGDQLTWDAVEGATGYNIYQDGYLDTVRGSLAFTVTEQGRYAVLAFDDNGNFSPSNGGESNTATFSRATFSYIPGDDFAYFNGRCSNLNAGETCTVLCPDSIEPRFNVRVEIGSTTGGACSSSDSVSMNSRVRSTGYSCTVSSFTSQVDAQAVCRAYPSSP